MAHGVQDRLTGAHETQKWDDQFSYGVSDRGASIRIPWQVKHRTSKGYIEDRRPNANVDPYVVARLLVEVVCGAASS
jgi:glutamine synthetase